MALSMLMSIPEEPKPKKIKHTQLEFNYE